MSVVTERLGAVARVRLDRPEALNALDLATRQELLAALEDVAGDPSVRAVILTGSGRSFCSGQDLAAREELVDAGATVADSYNPLARAIRGMDKPVIAAVNGLAVGAGMGLALCCDEVVMSAIAPTSPAPSCGSGSCRTPGTTSALVAALGHARAFELARTARRVPADEALALGLVNEVTSGDELEAAALRRAEELAAGPARALALTKRLLVAAPELSPDAVLDLEACSQGEAARSPEHAEGVAAFEEKRDPDYARAAAQG